MTVIAAMKFDKESSAMVADSLSSTQGGAGRQYAFAQKIHQIGEHTFIGGSGPSNILYEAATNIKKETLENTQKAAEILARILNYTHNKQLQGHLQGRFGISIEDIVSGTIQGTKPLDPQIKEEAMRAINNPDYRGTIICLGRTGELYAADTHSTQATIIAQPYAATGSGSDTADHILNEFVSEHSREKSIELFEGLGTLLYATHEAGERNGGVGGSPTIALFHQGKIYTPNENASINATLAVRGERKGVFGQEYTNEVIQASVLEKDVEAQEVLADMHSKGGAEFLKMLAKHK